MTTLLFLKQIAHVQGKEKLPVFQGPDVLPELLYHQSPSPMLGWFLWGKPPGTPGQAGWTLPLVGGSQSGAAGDSALSLQPSRSCPSAASHPSRGPGLCVCREQRTKSELQFARELPSSDTLNNRIPQKLHQISKILSFH